MMHAAEFALKGLPLPYQAEDLVTMDTCMAQQGSCIVGHKTGLGKTFIVLANAVRHGAKRILVVGTKKSAAIWITETAKWTNYPIYNITSKTVDKVGAWKLWCAADAGVFLVTAQMLQRLIGPTEGRQKAIRKSMKPWDVVACDEAHKYLRTHKTKTFKALKCLPFGIINIMSATLASRGPQDMWPSLNLIDPGFFSSFFRFVGQHCHVFITEYGRDIGPVRDAKYTKSILQKYYVSRGNEVRKQMPPIRQLVELDMDDAQAKAYWELVDNMILELDGGSIVVASSKMVLNGKLRQMALCPKIFDTSLPLGAGIDYIMEEMEEDPHTVVFTPQKAFIAVMATELTRRGYKVTIIQGGMESTEVNEKIKAWKAEKGVCLCTIASAESFRLDTVSTAYFLGAEYDPTLNIQAEGRLQAIDSPTDIGITIRYIIIKGTVEEGVKDIINGKVLNVSKFLDTYITKVKERT